MKRYRTLRGISQHDLAVAVGVTTGAISQYERAINTPRRKVAEAIDAQLTASGKVLEAFGYSTGDVTPSGGWVSLEQHVRLQDQVESLAARVQELGAEVERLRKRADRVDV